MQTLLFLIALLMFPATGVGQTVYFSADAESGTIVPPWNRNDNVKATIISDIVHSGSRAYRFELTNPCFQCDQSKVQSLLVRNRTYLVAGYYSLWAYIDEGLNDDRGTQFQFKLNRTTDGTGVGPKVSISVNNKGGGRQLYLNVSDCQLALGQGIILGKQGHKNDTQTCAWSQPEESALIVPFRRWYHLELYLKATQTNGEVKVWQNGTLIYHISHEKLNTLTLPSKGEFREYLQWHVGLYQYGSNTPQRLYIDDAMITDYRVFIPGYRTSSPPAGPNKLTVNTAK